MLGIFGTMERQDKMEKPQNRKIIVIKLLEVPYLYNDNYKTYLNIIKYYHSTIILQQTDKKL